MALARGRWLRSGLDAAWAGAVLLLFCAGVCPQARARGPAVVVVLTPNDDGEAQRLRAAIAAQLSSYAIDIQSRVVPAAVDTGDAALAAALDVAQSTDALLVVWTDGRRERLIAYARGGSEEQIVVRHLGEEGMERTTMAALAVRSLVQALLGGPELEAAEDPTASPADAPPPDPERGPPPAADAPSVPVRTNEPMPLAADAVAPPWLLVRVSVGALVYAPQVPLAAALSGDVWVSTGSFVWIVAGYRVELPRRLDAAGTTVEFTSHVPRLSVAGRFDLDPVALHVSAGFAASVLTWSFPRIGIDAEAVEQRARFNPAALVSVGIDWRWLSHLALAADLQLEAPFDEQRYWVSGAHESAEVLTPWIPRVALFVGAVVML